MAKQGFSLIKGDKIANADYRDALPVNMYVVLRDVRGSNGYLINQPGIELFGETSGTDRGAFYSDRFGLHLRVTGTSLVSIDEDGVSTVLGTVPGSLQVQMDQSFNNFAVLNENGELFYYNPTDGFRQITPTYLGTPLDLCFIDGYFFFTDGANLYHTTLNDEEDIDQLDYATAEFAPDDSICVKKTKENQVIVFGRYSTEWFYNAGNVNFAFSRISGKAVKAGIVATQCQTELDGQFFILGGRREESPSIHVISGGSLTTIATREIEKILAQYTEEELQTASLESRVEDGYMFIHVNLPNETLLYNHTAAKKIGNEFAWSILKTSIISMDGWLGINGIFDPRVSKWLYGDRFASRVGCLNNTISTLYGNKVECLFYSPFITLDGGSINEIEIKTISGAMPATSTVKKTTVSFSLSYNGESYGKEYFMDYGSINERAKRFMKYRLGYVGDYVGFKFRAVTESRLAFGALAVDYD